MDTRPPAYFGVARNRHKAFWRHEMMDRPLLGINVGMFFSDHFPNASTVIPERVIQPDEIPVQQFLEDCDRLHLHSKAIGEDFPFVASPFVYIPWMEAIMGCPVSATRSTIWAEPCVADWRNWTPPRSVLDNPWAQKLLDILKALITHADGRYPVSNTMMRGPSDMMAAMGGAEQLAVAVMDYPDRMKEIARVCGEIFVEIGKAQQELIPTSRNGYMDGDRGFRVWAPDKMIWLQEDAMALLSPQIYRDIFLPVDRYISNEFPAIAFHLHGSALWGGIDLAAAPEIDVIELNFEAAVIDIERTFEVCKIIQKSKPLVIWKLYDKSFWPWLDRALDEFPFKGLSFQVSVMDVKEAKEVIAGFLKRAADKSK